MAKRKFAEGGFAGPDGMPDRPAAGRLNQGQNVPSSPRMRSRGGFSRHGMDGPQRPMGPPEGMTARMPAGFPGGYPGGQMSTMPVAEGQMQVMPFAGPARSGPVSTFPTGTMQPNPEMDAFRAARAGGAPMKKGGKVAGYAKGGSVKGWGKARGGRAAKIL